MINSLMENPVVANQGQFGSNQGAVTGSLNLCGYNPPQYSGGEPITCHGMNHNGHQGPVPTNGEHTF